MLLRGAHRGRPGPLDEARAFAERGARIAAEVGDDIYSISSEAMLGHVDMLAGDLDAAADRLRPLPARLLGSGHPHGIAD